MSAVNPTITWANHTAMITGVRPGQRGVLLNETIGHAGTWPPVKVDETVDEEMMSMRLQSMILRSRRGCHPKGLRLAFDR